MLAVVVLAAGQGLRMRSSIPKILHNLCDKPVMGHVLDTVREIAPDQILVVTSPFLWNHPIFQGVTVVVQENPLGTGDAVMAAVPFLDAGIQEVLIVCGDTPLLQPETLRDFKKSQADLAIMAMPLSHPQQTYGRILCNEQQKPVAIVEYKEATPEQRSILLGNSGVYKVKVSLLRDLLSLIRCHDKGGEYYLTDIVELAQQQGKALSMKIANDLGEFQGINTRQDLSLAENWLQQLWRGRLMEEGVTLHQPETVFLSSDTIVGQDCSIGPFVVFGPGVCLENHVTILPFCHLEKTCVQSKAVIGPFARCRGSTVVQQKAQVGNFVEVKGSILGHGVKAKHLSYIGDTTIGQGTNIGAGTVTCNYDGFSKFKTEIGDHVMVGANSSLVAPLRVGDGSLIAAGSVITEDVPAQALAIGRNRQFNKKKK